METTIATAAVAIAPIAVQSIPIPGITLVYIVVVTTLLNMVRAYRHCKDSSWLGAKTGLKQGALAGLVAVLGSFALNFVPMLQVPFMILGRFADGAILAILYYLASVLLAHPIFGYC